MSCPPSSCPRRPATQPSPRYDFLVDEAVVHLPILDADARCVITHMDLLRVRAATSEEEQSEPGWAHRPKSD